MNRTQRREAIKKKAVNHALKQIEVEERKAGINFAVKAYLAATTMTLRDKFGFGPKRLKTFLEETQELFDSIEKGYVTVDDLLTTIFEETGIDLR